MAILMMSGLALGSLLTLLFVPAGYFLFFRFQQAGRLGQSALEASKSS